MFFFFIVICLSTSIEDCKTYGYRTAGCEEDLLYWNYLSGYSAKEFGKGSPFDLNCPYGHSAMRNYHTNECFNLFDSLHIFSPLQNESMFSIKMSTCLGVLSSNRQIQLDFYNIKIYLNFGPDRSQFMKFFYLNFILRK
jgi:hypothetical protein